MQIDNLLTPAALYNIRKVALESTTFFDSKVGYLGSYMDDGLQSVWIMKLARELQELMPRVLKDQALRQAWFYKYDSGSEDEVRKKDVAPAPRIKNTLNSIPPPSPLLATFVAEL